MQARQDGHQTQNGHQVTVAVRSRRRLFRDLIVACLASQRDFAVVGHVGEDTDLLELCNLHEPAVVLCDVGADAGGSLPLLSELRQRFGQSRVVLVHERIAPHEFRAAWRLGVARLVPWTHGLTALLAVLRECADATPPGTVLTDPARGLSDDDRAIVALVAGGYPAERIAQLLGTTTRAIENRKRRIYGKLRAVNQSHAIARVAALGLIGPTVPPVNHTPITRVEPAGPADPPGVGRFGPAPGTDRAEVPALTVRETQILRSIASGDTVRQTARSLGIAVKTVENTQARLFRKLGTGTRAAALAQALELGLVDLAGPDAQPDAATASPAP